MTREKHDMDQDEDSIDSVRTPSDEDESLPDGERPRPLSDGIASNPDFQSVDHEEYLRVHKWGDPD